MADLQIVMVMRMAAAAADAAAAATEDVSEASVHRSAETVFANAATAYQAYEEAAAADGAPAQEVEDPPFEGLPAALYYKDDKSDDVSSSPGSAESPPPPAACAGTFVAVAAIYDPAAAADEEEQVDEAPPPAGNSGTYSSTSQTIINTCNTCVFNIKTHACKFVRVS
jgi:hypothetical protein